MQFQRPNQLTDRHQFIIEQAKRIKAKSVSIYNQTAVLEMQEFLRVWCGPDSSFYKASSKPGHEWIDPVIFVGKVLDPFISYVENGLFQNHSWEREIQLETVSDYLSQAQMLVEDKSMHPAAAAVLIGASLEEFLRTWLEAIDVDTSSIKQTIAGYAQELKRLDLLQKQDLKDITSWAGIRNHAAHGDFDDVNDHKRIRLMLEGVNLFIRRHSSL